ncbi:MAG: type II secretion system F family protein [Acidobacteriota bacterium]
MESIIALTLFLFLMSAISYYGYRHYAKPGRIFEQIGGPAGEVETSRAYGAAGAAGLLIRTIRRVGEKVPISPQDASRTRRYLIAAGYRSDTALVTYYGVKVLLCIAMAGLIFALRSQLPAVMVLRVILVVGGVLAGFFIPNLVLDHLISKRHEEIRFALPDALDLMVVSVEGGLALDQAIQVVSRELDITHPSICDELKLVTLEMRAGTRRADALRHLADRTGETEIRSLVAILVQTDRFGTSMAESLRIHSEFLRIRRRQDAEERANKVGVKLVFPIFFCILPSMFLVTGGPAILQVFKQLRPLLRAFGN